MIRKFFISILILNLAVYVLSTSVIWTAYYIFKDYITENYCENKEKPSCSGKCHINKIDRETPKDKNIPKFEIREPEIVPFIVSDISIGSKNNFTKTAFNTKAEKELLGFHLELLKPPKSDLLS